MLKKSQVLLLIPINFWCNKFRNEDEVITKIDEKILKNAFQSEVKYTESPNNLSPSKGVLLLAAKKNKKEKK